MSVSAAANPSITPLALSPPEEGKTLEVAPGVRWIRMPLPFQLDHINLWLLEDEDGWTLVDTGYSSNRTRAIWDKLFAESLEGRPITRVISTHFHPDHMGLAGWLVDRWDCAFVTTLGEWLCGRMLSLETHDIAVARTARYYQRTGLAAETLAAITERANPYAHSVWPLPGSFLRVRDGEEIIIGGSHWRILVGRGHTPEHVCLHSPERRILISGDQVLPRISPNVSVWATEPLADPLRDFRNTINDLRQLPPDYLVLPSHDWPFHGLHARLEDLDRHHLERLDEAHHACATPLTAAEVTRIMFPRALDTHQTMFAVGEAVAHLNYLVAKKRLTRRFDPEDGVYRYMQPA